MVAALLDRPLATAAPRPGRPGGRASRLPAPAPAAAPGAGAPCCAGRPSAALGGLGGLPSPAGAAALSPRRAALRRPAARRGPAVAASVAPPGEGGPAAPAPGGAVGGDLTTRPWGAAASPKQPAALTSWRDALAPTGPDFWIETGANWWVRRVDPGGELRAVAAMQAQAFHGPVPIPPLDDLLRGNFESEIYGALKNKIRFASPRNYACLVASPPPPEAAAAAAAPGAEAAPGGAIAAPAHRIAGGPLPPAAGVVELCLDPDTDPEVPGQLGAAHFAYASCMAVEASQRRRGAALALLAAAEAVAADWGAPWLALHVHQANAAARTAYLRAGFEVVHEEPGWMRLIPGRLPKMLLRKRVAGVAPEAMAPGPPAGGPATAA